VPFVCPTFPNVGLSSPGAYAQYVAVPATQAIALPDDVPIGLASNAEPLAVSMNAVQLARLEPGDSVLVYGVGPIGLNAIIALHLAGIETVVAAGRSATRRAAAAALGATDVFDTRTISVPDYAAKHDQRFTAVLECSGSPNASDDALAVLEPAGVLVELGVVSHQVAFPVISLVGNGTTVVGSCAFDYPTYSRAVDDIVSGRAPVASLVSEQVGLDATPDALVRLRTPGDLVRVIARPLPQD
jgi:threonine dehydrogenase-like Zn-dependent dehydrogenase